MNHPPNHQNAFLESEESLEEFVHQWKAGKLPRAEWTHAAHVCVATYHAFDHQGEELFQQIKAGLIHHNNSVGTLNTEESGYHETLTRLWVNITEEFVRTGAFSTRLQAVKSAVEQFGSDSGYHRNYYSFDVVKDKRARREWIPPDRTPPAQPRP